MQKARDDSQFRHDMPRIIRFASMTSPHQIKQQLRQQATERRKAQDNTLRRRMSAEITQRLIDHLKHHAPDTSVLLAYRAMNSEVNIDSLFRRHDYRLFAPVTHHHEHMEWLHVDDNTQWQRGLFGILEPRAGHRWQGDEGASILLCPLTAFDRRGNRLGMGKGCFDFWLSGHRSRLQYVIGLAFSCQEVDEIPAEPHDIPMDFVITEQEVIPCLKN